MFRMFAGSSVRRDNDAAAELFYGEYSESELKENWEHKLTRTLIYIYVYIVFFMSSINRTANWTWLYNPAL